MLWKQIKSNELIKPGDLNAFGEIAAAAVMHFLPAVGSVKITEAGAYLTPQLGKSSKFRLMSVVSSDTGFHIVSSFGNLEYVQFKCKLATGRAFPKGEPKAGLDPVWGADNCKDFATSYDASVYCNNLIHKIKAGGDNITFGPDCTKQAIHFFSEFKKNPPMVAAGIPFIKPQDVTGHQSGVVATPWAAAPVPEVWSGDW